MRRGTIGAYQITASWTETEVTWIRRNGENWTTPGGDHGSKLDDAVVSNTAGHEGHVRRDAAGEGGGRRRSRLVTLHADRADGSRRSDVRVVSRILTPKDPNIAARPVLKVVYGGAAPPPPPRRPSGSTTLRVLHWNTHHGGVGSDGVWDPQRLMKWVAKFNPDIVSLNEVERYTSWGKNTDEPATLLALMKQYTGKTGTTRSRRSRAPPTASAA